MLAAAAMLAGYHPTTSSISSKKKIHTSQIKDGFNTSENSSTNQFVHRRRRRRVQHITNQPHPQIDSYITDKGAGLNKKKLILTGGDTGAPEKGDCRGDTVRLPPPPLAGAPFLPSDATALSPPSLPQAMRARRPDPAAEKPDPVAVRTDPVAGKPDPVAGNAGG